MYIVLKIKTEYYTQASITRLKQLLVIRAFVKLLTQILEGLYFSYTKSIAMVVGVFHPNIMLVA